MNIFGFRPFKGKFNLGNSDDIPTNQDGTLIGSIKQINSDLGNKSSASSVTGDDAFTKIENLNDIVAHKQPSGYYVKFGTMNNLQDMYFQLYIDGATKYLQVILTINGTPVTRTITQWT